MFDLPLRLLQAFSRASRAVGGQFCPLAARSPRLARCSISCSSHAMHMRASEHNSRRWAPQAPPRAQGTAFRCRRRIVSGHAAAPAALLASVQVGCAPAEARN